MQLVYWVVFSFLVAFAITDDAQSQELTLPVELCSLLAEQYKENPYKMTIGELDTFRLCVVELMVMKQQAEVKKR